MENKINGFTKNQIFQLYEYLVVYEDLGLSNFKSTKAMLCQHPGLSYITTLQKRLICHKAKAKEIENVNFKELKNEVFMTVRNNQLLSFLSHLRNAIAHGGAVEHKGNVLITDFENPRYHPVTFTARGCVTFDIINDITSLLKNIQL